MNNEIIIKTEKLAIAGANTTGPNGASTSLIISDPEGNNFNRYFTKDATSAIIKMAVTPNIIVEGNGINRIEYSIGALGTVVDDTFRPFGEVELDITEYLPKMSTSQYTLVSGAVYDLNNARKPFKF